MRVRRIVKLADHDGIIAFAMEGEALRAQMAEDTVQCVIDSVHRATNKWACKKMDVKGEGRVCERLTGR